MRKVIYVRKKKRSNFTEKIYFFSFILVTGITLGYILFYSVIIYLNVTQERYALSPLSLNTNPLSLVTGAKSETATHDGGENAITTPPPQNVGIIFHGLRGNKQIALTFDADMTPGMKDFLLSGKVKSYYDANAIRILSHTHTKATFFLSGMWIELYPQITKSLAKNSLFELGNHSYSHPSFDGACYGLRRVTDSTAKEEEIMKTQMLLKDTAGISNTLFRFPGGCYSQSDLEIAKKAGVNPIQWDVVGNDGFNDNAAVIEQNVLSRVQDGSIIVLHMNGYPNEPKTAEALSHIIPALKQKGYTFVTVSELLAPRNIFSSSLRPQTRL